MLLASRHRAYSFQSSEGTKFGLQAQNKYEKALRKGRFFRSWEYLGALSMVIDIILCILYNTHITFKPGNLAIYLFSYEYYHQNIHGIDLYRGYGAHVSHPGTRLSRVPRRLDRLKRVELVFFEFFKLIELFFKFVLFKHVVTRRLFEHDRKPGAIDVNSHPIIELDGDRTYGPDVSRERSFNSGAFSSPSEPQHVKLKHRRKLVHHACGGKRHLDRS